MHQLYLIGYDIGDHRRSTRVLRAIRAHAVGGQKSLYECRLESADLAPMLGNFRSLLDAGKDRLLLLRLDPRATIHTLGTATSPSDGSLFQVG